MKKKSLEEKYMLFVPQADVGSYDYFQDAEEDLEGKKLPKYLIIDGLIYKRKR